MNPFVTGQANAFWNEFMEDPLQFNLSKYFPNVGHEELDKLRPANESEINYEWLQYIITHPKFDENVRREFSFWPDLFFDCHFRFVSCNHFDLLENFYHMNYGNCFRINGKTKDIDGKEIPSLTVGREGDGFGISMFIGPSDLFYHYTYQSFDLGIKIFITDRDVIPFAQPGILIKPGTTASIQVLFSFSLKNNRIYKC